MKGGEGWRRTELLDGAFWRAERRTERHISPNAHQTLSPACREDPVLWQRPDRDTEDTLDSGQAMETLPAVTFGSVWPCREFSLKEKKKNNRKTNKHLVQFISPLLFLRHSDGDGASTQRAEPSSQTGPSRAHQLRHRPDSGRRYGAGERAHGWKTKWIRIKQRGRLLQFRKPDRSQRALVHRAVYLPLRDNASGGGFRFIRGEQESGQPGSDPSPGSQTHDSTGTTGPRAGRCPRVWRAVLPLDRKQVRQGQNIR